MPGGALVGMLKFLIDGKLHSDEEAAHYINVIEALIRQGTLIGRRALNQIFLYPSQFWFIDAYWIGGTVRGTMTKCQEDNLHCASHIPCSFML